jgi:hypothetical protein
MKQVTVLNAITATSVLAMFAATTALAGPPATATDHKAATNSAQTGRATTVWMATGNTQSAPGRETRALREPGEFGPWTNVDGSIDLQYRSADDPNLGGCGKIQFRGPSGGQYTVHVTTSGDGLDHTETMGVFLRPDGYSLQLFTVWPRIKSVALFN